MFTNYLSKISNTWKEQVGNDAAIDWPTGIGGKGNEGVAAYVRRIKGAIGYVEFAYTKQAKQNQLSYVQLQNKAGYFVTPSIDRFQAAAANADWEAMPDFAIILTDEPGDNSWPIIGATFILIQAVQTKPEQGKGVLHFFDWAYHHGAAVALQLDYIPLPSNTVKLIENAWKNQIKDKDGKPIWP